MDIDQVRQRGQAMRMTALEEMSKGDIIRVIQLAEGSSACFGNFWRFDYLGDDHCWREDCLIMKLA